MDPYQLLLRLLDVAERVSKQGSSYRGVCQKTNLRTLVRRVRLLVPVLEEVRDSNNGGGGVLQLLLVLPSALSALEKLHRVMSTAEQLVNCVMSSGQLWLLAECHALSHQFAAMSSDMATSLRLLPLDLMEELSIDLKEQLELLRLQSARSKGMVDAMEAALHTDLINLVTLEFDKKKTPNSDRLHHLFNALHLVSAQDCERELRHLESRSDHSSSQIKLHSLINFLCYSSCLLFGGIIASAAGREGGGGDEEATQPPPSPTVTPPDEYKCPISLELMNDPVIIATGHTYERESIQTWVEAGSMTCPKSGQKLIYTALIPNFALRSLISQWCRKNKLPSSSSSERIDELEHKSWWEKSEAATSTASYLVGKLATGAPRIQRQAACELRLLAKAGGADVRRRIAEVGAIPFLVSLLRSPDPASQENSITALLNLSILTTNKPLIVSAAALTPIIEVVLSCGHTSASRDNAAATLFSLSTGGDEASNKMREAIGNVESAIPELLQHLSKSDSSSSGKKDAASALFNLSLLPANKPKLLQAGAVEQLLLVATTAQEEDLVETCLSLSLRLVSFSSSLQMDHSLVPSLVALLLGSDRIGEYAVGILLALCTSQASCHNEAACRSLLAVPSSISALHNLLSNGRPRAKRKAASIIKTLQEYSLPS